MARWQRLLAICDTDDSTGQGASAASMIVNYDIYSVFRPWELAFIHGTNRKFAWTLFDTGHMLGLIGQIDWKRASVMKIIKEMLCMSGGGATNNEYTHVKIK